MINNQYVMNELVAFFFYVEEVDIINYTSFHVLDNILEWVTEMKICNY